MNLRARVLVPVLALTLTACGSDDADAKAAYVEQATGVCERAQQEFSKLAAPTTPAGIGAFADSTVAIAEKAQRDLAALTPPEDDRADLKAKVLDPYAALVVQAKDFAGKVKAAGSDQAALLPLLSQRPTTGDIDLEYLRSYGLGTCADAIDLS